MQEKTHYSKSGLKARGWTDVAIANFLKTHDKEARNPMFRTASPMKLYLISRVEETEKTDAFKLFFQESIVRKEASKKAVNTKIERLIAELNQWNISVKKEDFQKVMNSAIQSYNNFKEEIAFERDDSDFVPASHRSDNGFLQRICVNHLRHQFSDYEERLEKLYGKVGKGEAYKILNGKIYDAIASAYPALADECQRQFDRKCGIDEQYEELLSCNEHSKSN